MSVIDDISIEASGLADFFAIESPEKRIDSVKPEGTSFPHKQIDDFEFFTDEIVKNKILNLQIDSVNERSTWVKKNISAYDLVGCIRKIYFGFKGIPESNAPSYAYSPIIFAIGNAIHEVLEKSLSIQETEVDIKTSIDDFTFSMRCDGILNDKILVEFKTVDTIVSLEKPKPEHLAQAFIYAYFLNKYLKRNIDTIQIVYVARGKIDVKCFKNSITTEMMRLYEKKLTDQLLVLKKCLNDNIAPPSNCRYVSTDCTFCGYKDYCKTLASKYKSIKKG